MTYVLDSSAVIAMLRNEDGGEKTAEILDDVNSKGYIHAVNLIEVEYELVRSYSLKTAVKVIESLQQTRLSTRYDLDKSFSHSVAHLKGTIKRVSLADCFAITLANQLGGVVITSDHHEFDALVEKDICQVLFIR